MPLSRHILSTFVVLCQTILTPQVWSQDTTPLLSEIFRDNAVVQRDGTIPVWGTAPPGEHVTVEFAGERATSVADDRGVWSAKLPPVPAGGPHVLTARTATGAAQTIKDVLVGDVFLCAGQSNMALPVSRTLNPAAEARRATDGRIRMLTVPLGADPAPQQSFVDAVAWEVASPETVPNWSATCYYFARELRDGPLADEDVPVGLITAAWGGSRIQPWMAPHALASVGGYDDDLNLLHLYRKDQRAAQVMFGGRWQDWWTGATGDAADTAPWQPDRGRSWRAAPHGLGDWTQWEDLHDFTGMVWFRTALHLTSEQASGDATLRLGAVDEIDQTWINGRIVANTFGYGTERTYTIPAELLREGENVIVVNVLNTYASGGLTGDPERRALHLADGTQLPLREWRYRPVREHAAAPPRAPWESVGGLSTIHNGMIAPLRNYGIRGVVWYQGESNTGDGNEYEPLLRALMTQLRGQFGSGSTLPVLVVQLPNYGPRPTAPKESGWAEVRNAQRLATDDDPNAAFAVTIEVGDPHDIHPANKQAVGARLSRAARRTVYGEPVTPSGPVPVAAERRGDIVAVSFDEIDGGLVAYNATGPIGFELCGDGPATCRYADARVNGSEVLISVDGEEPVSRVRYAWSDSPIVNFFDGSGLPVGSFEISLSERR